MGDSPNFVTWNDFSGGDWGTIGEYRAKPNQFSGVNMVLYDNGMLGPRAGLHENTYTGTMQGDVHGMYLVGNISYPVMIFAGDQVYSATGDNITLGTVTSRGTLDAEPTDSVVATWYDPNGDVYFTSPEDATYYIDWTTFALNKIQLAAADIAGTATAYLCRDRLYLAGDRNAGLGHRVYYSAGADFTDFDGGGYFDVGYFQTIRSLMETQDSLMMSALESTNNLGTGVGWYSLVGATPQGSLRRVNTQIASGDQTEVVNADNGNVYYWTGWSTSDSDNPYLVQSNGAKFDEETYHHLRLQGTTRYGYFNSSDKTLIYVSDEGNNAMMRCNGAWSYLDFEVDVSGPVCPTEAGDSFLLAYGAPATDVKVYELLSSPNQPGVAGGQQNPGDDSNTPINAFFFLPAHQSDTKEYRVRRVIVDFKKWNTVHSATNNEFTVNLRTWGQYNLPSGTADGINLETATFSENQTNAATDGTMDRYVMRAGHQGWAPGFQVYLTGIKGCAFESITVEYDEQSAVGRTK